jgi:hypothetical protein
VPNSKGKSTRKTDLIVQKRKKKREKKKKRELGKQLEGIKNKKQIRYSNC